MGPAPREAGGPPRPPVYKAQRRSERQETTFHATATRARSTATEQESRDSPAETRGHTARPDRDPASCASRRCWARLSRVAAEHLPPRRGRRLLRRRSPRVSGLSDEWRDEQRATSLQARLAVTGGPSR